MKFQKMLSSFFVTLTEPLYPQILKFTEHQKLRRSHSRGSALPRVTHVSPAYFDNLSYIGGGERYALSLASAIAKYLPSKFVTFGPSRRSLTYNHLRVEVYPQAKSLSRPHDPVSLRFMTELWGSDIVHCHQFRTVVGNMSIMMGALLGSRVYVNDLGGLGRELIGIVKRSELVDGFLPISTFSANFYPEFRRIEVVQGGVEDAFLQRSLPAQREAKALFVGRILPHKGINYLIEAMPPDVTLEVIGRTYDEEYFQALVALSRNKKVIFHTSASDDDLIKAYLSASVTVLPSVYTDMYGRHHVMPELLGLVLLESMACGCPVICTDVGGMPEFVEEGVTGFVVPPNDTTVLRQRIEQLVRNPELVIRMGSCGAQRVSSHYTWDAVAKRCIEVYTEVAQ